MLLEDLGNRIRSQRERLGLKQHDVAHALQVSPQAVSKWERGENAPDIAILGALAKLLGVSTDWLLDTYGEGLDVFEATVFASSVTGAYEKSLQMAAREFASWANGFFSQLTEAVLRHDGVPIKYMGDQFLCFFSGTEHRRRAVKAAFLAKRMVAENLQIGLSSGEIYLGAVGHPDYARADIMGEIVNIAFLTKDWAETNTESSVAATAAVVKPLEQECKLGESAEVNFKDIENPVRVVELRGISKPSEPGR
ncbi:MAG TPA: helix-turn-helix domain-containing protein [Candidatus Hydrogenedentes bacterium]|nr:helix-turn-helix domain-containing protein [Candidatus Hydrogenedentota bacterium]